MWLSYLLFTGRNQQRRTWPTRCRLQRPTTALLATTIKSCATYGNACVLHVCPCFGANVVIAIEQAGPSLSIVPVVTNFVTPLGSLHHDILLVRSFRFGFLMFACCPCCQPPNSFEAFPCLFCFPFCFILALCKDLTSLTPFSLDLEVWFYIRNKLLCFIMLRS